jgi:hypothetical protein
MECGSGTLPSSGTGEEMRVSEMYIHFKKVYDLVRRKIF